VTTPVRQLARAAPPPTRVVIVDDHELARAGLRSILACESQAEVVGEAASGQEALAVCRQLHPDVVLMDVHMPDLDGLAATRVLKQEQPGLHVILISMHESPDYLLEALRAGASGYLLKGATRKMIMGTLRQALRGKAAFHPELAAQVLRQMGAGVNGNAARLTPRELEILQLLSQGRSARWLPAVQQKELEPSL
jgi:DNA-binding NarL/FixJ family response regulator